MSVFKTIRTTLANNNIPTLRYDSNGIHRSWNYNKHNETEVNAIKSLADYATAHKIPQHKINVWTDDNRVYYNIRNFMHGWTHDRFTHYMAYPNQVKDAPRHSNSTYWSLTFTQANNLNPDYHFTCIFYNVGSCRFCHGPNEHP